MQSISFRISRLAIAWSVTLSWWWNSQWRATPLQIPYLWKAGCMTQKRVKLNCSYNGRHLGDDGFHGSEWFCDSLSLDYTHLSYLLGICLKKRSTISTMSWTWFEQWRLLVFRPKGFELWTRWSSEWKRRLNYQRRNPAGQQRRWDYLDQAEPVRAEARHMI